MSKRESGDLGLSEYLNRESGDLGLSEFLNRETDDIAYLGYKECEVP